MLRGHGRTCVSKACTPHGVIVCASIYVAMPFLTGTCQLIICLFVTLRHEHQLLILCVRITLCEYGNLVTKETLHNMFVIGTATGVMITLYVWHISESHAS